MAKLPPWLFDTPPTYNEGNVPYSDLKTHRTIDPGFNPRKQGALSLIGDAMKGIADPWAAVYGGDSQSLYRSQMLRQKQDEADMEFQKYLIKKRRGDSDINIFQIDPISGELKHSGSAPYGSKVYKGVLSPEQMKERAVATGEAESIKSNIQMGDKLAGAVKKLSVLNRQYNKALPTGDRTPLEQRLLGGAESWAAKKGLVDNPELVALKKNSRPIAINLIRLFGEVGNLSESEQQGALDVVSQEGLTEKERYAQVRQFAEYSLAGASEDTLKVLKKRKDIRGVLDAFGIDLSDGSESEKSVSTNNLFEGIK